MEISELDLLHHRLQAILRDYNMPDLEYIGIRPSYKTGEDVHWYRIGKAEVPIDAITEFEKVLVIDSEDGPSQTYIKRCASFLESPPEKDWDGVFTFTEKG